MREGGREKQRKKQYGPGDLRNSFNPSGSKTGKWFKMVALTKT